MYYATIDCILLELNERFASKNPEIAQSTACLSPDNGSFLEFEKLQHLIDHLCLAAAYEMNSQSSNR
jgi:hypothetical protein